MIMQNKIRCLCLLSMVNNGRKEAVPHVCVMEVCLAVTQKSVLLFTVTRSVKSLTLQLVQLLVTLPAGH